MGDFSVLFTFSEDSLMNTYYFYNKAFIYMLSIMKIYHLYNKDG